MANLIQIRRGAAATWTSVNPVLALGEIGIETDTHLLKAGDGVSTWSNLPYLTITNGGATDTVIGNRTVDQTLAPAGKAVASPLTTLLSNFAYEISQIIGADWSTLPANSIATISQIIAGTSATKIPSGALAPGIGGMNVVSITYANSPYTIPAWGYHIEVDATSGNVVVNVPSAVNNTGSLIEVHKTDNTVNTVTITPNAGQTIGGQALASLVMYNQDDSYSLRSLGGNLAIV